MVRTTGIGCMISAGLFFLLVSSEHLHAATLPIAEGNTWIYCHNDTLENCTVPQPGVLIKSSNVGLFTMRMDSVIIRTDTVLFNVTTDDSGVTSTGSTYNNRSLNKYMKIENGLFTMNTATNGWLPCSDPLITFTSLSDTTYRISVVLKKNDYEEDDSSLNSSRNTDSSVVIVNGTDKRKLYTSDTSFWRSVVSCMKGSFGELITCPYLNSLEDTLHWLDGIGVMSHIYIYDSETGINTSMHGKNYIKETYSLLSFNGNPVSIVPDNTDTKTSFSLTDGVSVNQTRKVILLNAPFYSPKEFPRYFNLLGRKSGGNGSSAQLFIAKEKKLNTQFADK